MAVVNDKLLEKDASQDFCDLTSRIIDGPIDVQRV